MLSPQRIRPSILGLAVVRLGVTAMTRAAAMERVRVEAGEMEDLFHGANDARSPFRLVRSLCIACGAAVLMHDRVVREDDGGRFGGPLAV